MRIVHRDLSLKYPRAICRDKQQIVLDWLLEFRFSSFALPGPTPRPDVPHVLQILSLASQKRARATVYP